MVLNPDSVFIEPIPKYTIIDLNAMRQVRQKIELTCNLAWSRLFPLFIAVKKDDILSNQGFLVMMMMIIMMVMTIMITMKIMNVECIWLTSIDAM